MTPRLKCTSFQQDREIVAAMKANHVGDHVANLIATIADLDAQLAKIIMEHDALKDRLP